MAQALGLQHQGQHPVDQGHEDVIADGIDDGGKRATDDDTDGHIKDISSFYPYLLMGEKGRERKEYMTSPEKVLILANSILSLNPIFTNF